MRTPATSFRVRGSSLFDETHEIPRQRHARADDEAECHKSSLPYFREYVGVRSHPRYTPNLRMTKARLAALLAAAPLLVLAQVPLTPVVRRSIRRAFAVIEVEHNFWGGGGVHIWG